MYDFIKAFMLIKYYILHLAPGSYDIEKAEKSIKQSSGAVTFGIKHKEPKPDTIPGTFISILKFCMGL